MADPAAVVARALNDYCAIAREEWCKQLLLRVDIGKLAKRQRSRVFGDGTDFIEPHLQLTQDVTLPFTRV